MKQILIPTDFSDNAWNAIKYGMELFQNNKCSFHLLHINRIDAYPNDEHIVANTPVRLEEFIKKETEVQLQQLLNKIQPLQNNVKHTFKTQVMNGFFVNSIKKAITEQNIELIIMGTKGATGLKKMTMGSNTADVMTKVKCPLMAIPENAVYSKFKEIAFPTDYRINYDLQVLDPLLEIRAINNATIQVLHVTKKGRDLDRLQIKNKALLHDFFKDSGPGFHEISGKKLETTVQSFVESSQVGMISMVAKNLNFLQRILFKPTVEEISYLTDIPFLVLHE